MQDEIPHRRGEPDEVLIDDRFPAGGMSSYAGKFYPSATEVLSMGLERLYRDPAKFAEQDAEYFKLIVGILHGTLLGAGK
jgi:hypothetical protein